MSKKTDELIVEKILEEIDVRDLMSRQGQVAVPTPNYKECMVGYRAGLTQAKKIIKEWLLDSEDE